MVHVEKCFKPALQISYFKVFGKKLHQTQKKICKHKIKKLCIPIRYPFCNQMESLVGPSLWNGALWYCAGPQFTLFMLTSNSPFQLRWGWASSNLKGSYMNFSNEWTDTRLAVTRFKFWYEIAIGIITFWYVISSQLAKSGL